RVRWPFCQTLQKGAPWPCFDDHHRTMLGVDHAPLSDEFPQRPDSDGYCTDRHQLQPLAAATGCAAHYADQLVNTGSTTTGPQGTRRYRLTCTNPLLPPSSSRLRKV